MIGPSSDPDAVARLLRRRASAGELVLPVDGTSMAGTIVAGSKVVVGPHRSARTGEVWAFVADTGQIVIHRVRRFDGGLVVTRGTGNPSDDDPISVSRLIGPVVRASGPDGRTRSFNRWDRKRSALLFQLRAAVRRRLRRVSRQPCGFW